MGRQVRRVPLDFAWPVGKTWEGFCNPHYRPCPEADKGLCHNGSSNAGKWLESVTRLLSLIGEEATAEPHAAQLRARGRTFPHPYLDEWSQAPRTPLPRAVEQAIHKLEPQQARMLAAHQALREHPPRLLSFGGDEMIALVRGLAKGRALGPLAGSSASYEIGLTLLKAAGIEDEKWGTCKVCGGHGDDPATREAYENWKEEPPPTGDAWQMWETTSEGSPISPPKATPEALARWLADNNASAFGHDGASYESWMRMIVGSGWAPSAVMVDGMMMSGVEAAP